MATLDIQKSFIINRPKVILVFYDNQRKSNVNQLSFRLLSFINTVPVKTRLIFRHASFSPLKTFVPSNQYLERPGCFSTY